MKSIVIEFEKRVSEVELYHDFISTVIDKKPLLNFGKEALNEKIDKDIYPILKANMFLLLYNLVESSFKEALHHLSEQINNSNLKYKDSIPEVRKLWIECEKRYFEKNPNNVKKLEYFYSIIENIKEENLSVPSSLKGANMSGNLDSKKVKDCMKRYGITLNTEKGKKLVIVKNKRNNLAHGNVSFRECGRDLVTSELKEIKKDVIDFMRTVIALFQEKCKAKYFYKNSM
ncbi:MAG: MAE_28990/MAE_18760 family HEPN-like nuclease [Mariprofundaceae bacterium]|nr:MAE_28990/MAE_18760 family HEPN-like nuclease [Mariprofundaceae bacterium]